MSRWQAESRLHRVYPGVYAVGHDCLPTKGKLAAALFYAGPGSALSHVTAGWWSGILSTPPSRLHVSAPGKRRSLREVCVHGRKVVTRIWHEHLPVTPAARTLLDIAGQVRFTELRKWTTGSEPEQVLRSYIAKLEEHVRADPEHYFWAYNRWKREKPLYG